MISCDYVQIVGRIKNHKSNGSVLGNEATIQSLVEMCQAKCLSIRDKKNQSKLSSTKVGTFLLLILQYAIGYIFYPFFIFLITYTTITNIFMEDLNIWYWC